MVTIIRAHKILRFDYPSHFAYIYIFYYSDFEPIRVTSTVEMDSSEKYNKPVDGKFAVPQMNKLKEDDEDNR